MSDDSPLVRLGQGEYAREIRPSDLRRVGTQNSPQRAPGSGDRPIPAHGQVPPGARPFQTPSALQETPVMNPLDTITRPTAPRPRRTLLYGTHGIGKSTFAAMSPRPIFIQTEDGLGDIDVDRFPLATSLRQVLEQLDALLEQEHEFETVVIDSLDWLERLIWSEVCRERSVKTIEDVPYARGYAFAVHHWQQVITRLDRLRDERGMSVILLAHAAIEKVLSPEHDTYDRYAPRLQKHASALVQEWCDEVLFASYRVHTKTVSEGFDRKRAQGIGTGERIVRTSERPGHVANNRCSLPDVFPLDHRLYAAHVRGEVPSQPAAAAAETGV